MSDTEAVPRAARPRQPMPNWLAHALSVILFVLLIALWQFAAGRWISSTWISSPSLIWTRFVEVFSDGSIFLLSWTTLEEAVIGLVVGVGSGLVAGVALALLPSTKKVLDPFLKALNSLPRVALAPFFVLWVGIGLPSKVLLVWSIVFFIALFNIMQGMRTIDQDLMDVMKSMRASQLSILRYVTVPSLLPWLMSTITIGLAMALTAAVVGEMLGAQTGLGWYINNTLSQFDMTGAIVGLVAIVVLSMILYAVMSTIERRLFAWSEVSSSATAQQQL